MAGSRPAARTSAAAIRAPADRADRARVTLGPFDRLARWLDRQPPGRRRLYSLFLGITILTVPCYAAGLLLLVLGGAPPAAPEATPSAAGLETAVPTVLASPTPVERVSTDAPEPTEEPPTEATPTEAEPTPSATLAFAPTPTATWPLPSATWAMPTIEVPPTFTLESPTWTPEPTQPPTEAPTEAPTPEPTIATSEPTTSAD